MITKTFAGSNLLVLGLVSHFSGIILGMMAFEGAGIFSISTYLIGSLLLTLGLFIEFNHLKKRPLSNWHFYMASIFSLFLVVGPIGSLWILYKLCNEEKQPKTLTGFTASIFTMNVHPVVLGIWCITFFIVFVLIFQQNDPYFSQHR